MAILYSFRVKGLVHLIKSSIVLLFIPILLSFALTLYSNGVYNSILHSAFDISYFNMFVPFLIIYLALIVCQPEEIKKG